MAVNPRRLRPIELVRLLNSTPLGEVIGERQLYRHRQRAGHRITSASDANLLDLLRYVGWLVIERHHPRPEPEGLTGYEAHKDRALQRNRELSLSSRNIDALPAIVNPERRERAARDFRYFCETYFPQIFTLRWSPDHLKVIGKIEKAVLEGGLFAMAMPRGSGKTSMCEIACIWALIYGHREFVALIGADEEHASKMLESIKSELENNDALLEDFPEVVFPIRCLERIHQRASGQLYQGRPTHISWTARQIVLPTMPESVASGAVICVAGITGRIRGMKHKRVDGTPIRPSLVLIDDPQTDDSAKSPTQCKTREDILAGAILGLAGPNRKIAGLMTLTVVRPDDLADRILDREKHPQWQGERTKMVYQFPTNEKLWSKYSELWKQGMKSEAGIAQATEFYRAHREAMDAGADVAWPERHEPGELSAIQHAMNLRLGRGEAAFWAEYQNEPLPDQQVDTDLLTADQIAAKVNGIKRGIVPKEATALTTFIDVQRKALFYMVVAWMDNFTGWIVDYGTEPDQKVPYYSLRDIRHSLEAVVPGAGQEAAIYAGLERLTERVLGKEWPTEDGLPFTMDKCLIDANWGPMTQAVYQFCRQSRFTNILYPSHGRFVGAASHPFSEYRAQPGDRIGLNWRIHRTSRRAGRYVLYDTNFWKSFIQSRLSVAKGDPGSLTLFGRKPEHHRLLAEHLTSEYRVTTQGRGRTVEEWKIRLASLDNHWLDGVVGCAVAGSIQGIELAEMKVNRPRKRIKFSELQRRWKEGRD